MSFGVPLGIAGVGLIGGSIALRARERGIRVLGYDTDPAAANLVDTSVGSLEALAEQSETLVLALPLDATLAAIDSLKSRAAGRPHLVVDVASVKVPIVARAGAWERFAATHPIAGAERGGPQAARPDLFEGRVWAYVPADPGRDAAVRALVEAMGARPLAVEPVSHDRTVALTSHLPQVVVSTLAAMLADGGLQAELAGPGLASTLRLAGSPWQVWEPIVRANAPALAQALRDLGKRLSELGNELEAGDVSRAASYFENARASYERFVRRPSD